MKRIWGKLALKISLALMIVLLGIGVVDVYLQYLKETVELHAKEKRILQQFIGGLIDHDVGFVELVHPLQSGRQVDIIPDSRVVHPQSRTYIPNDDRSRAYPHSCFEVE